MSYGRNTNCGHGWSTVETPLEGKPGWFQRVANDCTLCPDHKAGIPYMPGTAPKPPPPEPDPQVNEEGHRLGIWHWVQRLGFKGWERHCQTCDQVELLTTQPEGGEVCDRCEPGKPCSSEEEEAKQQRQPCDPRRCMPW